jgi:hypothetical protein
MTMKSVIVELDFVQIDEGLVALGDALKVAQQRNRKIVTAESCTG